MFDYHWLSCIITAVHGGLPASVVQVWLQHHHQDTYQEEEPRYPVSDCLFNPMPSLPPSTEPSAEQKPRKESLQEGFLYLFLPLCVFSPATRQETWLLKGAWGETSFQCNGWWCAKVESKGRAEIQATQRLQFWRAAAGPGWGLTDPSATPSGSTKAPSTSPFHQDQAFFTSSLPTAALEPHYH